jgi:hypothetical protein
LEEKKTQEVVDEAVEEVVDTEETAQEETVTETEAQAETAEELVKAQTLFYIQDIGQILLRQNIK